MNKKFLMTEMPKDKIFKLYMTFCIADKYYAAAAQSIVEVIKLPTLDTPENLPENIVGILNLRGVIINVIDIREFLGLPQTEYSTENCILVLSHNDMICGLIVDTVNNVINIELNTISATPYGAAGSNKIISSVAKKDNGLLSILNLDYITSFITTSMQHSFESKTQTTKTPSKRITFTNDSKSIETFERRARELQTELSLNIEKEEKKEQRFVTFLLNNEMYGISLKHIREFSKIINLATVPCVPEFYIGLSNLRGEFIPVLDIKGFLGISKTMITEKTKIIFAKTPRMQIGIIVDEVFDIISVSSEQINKSGMLQNIDKNKYTSGEIILNEKTIISIFDLEKFLMDDRLIIEEAV